MKGLKFIVTGVFALFLATGLWAQQTSQPDASGQEKVMGGQMMEQCRAMMGKHQEMKKQMAVLDAKLEEKLAAVKAAKGNQKVDAMAAVIEELVAQRRTMRERMMAGMPQMMGHMMEHMRSGMMQGEGMSMADCPMMKGMMGEKGGGESVEKPGAGGHRGHH